MYERFTDRARKVMVLANQEALRFRHEYIGTEHILLALTCEGSGVAANVLKNLDIDLRKVRQEVEKIVLPGPDVVAQAELLEELIELLWLMIEEAVSRHDFAWAQQLGKRQGEVRRIQDWFKSRLGRPPESPHA